MLVFLSLTRRSAAFSQPCAGGPAHFSRRHKPELPCLAVLQYQSVIRDFFLHMRCGGSAGQPLKFRSQVRACRCAAAAQLPGAIASPPQVGCPSPCNLPFRSWLSFPSARIYTSRAPRHRESLAATPRLSHQPQKQSWPARSTMRLLSPPVRIKAAHGPAGTARRPQKAAAGNCTACRRLARMYCARDS